MLLTLHLPILVLSCLTSAASIRHTRAFAGSTSPQPDSACTNDYDWIGDNYNAEDCMAALQRLFNLATAQYGSTEFEFLAPGARNKTNLPTIQTPQRYTSGQGTVAIVMLNSFEPGSLPGEQAGGSYKYSDTDVASYDDLWEAGGLIEMKCVIPQKSLGWAPTGAKYAIGIFIWNTNSYWNREIPFSPPNNVTSLQNATASPSLAITSSDQEQLAYTSTTS